MSWFQGGRAEPAPAFGFVRTYPPSQLQVDRQRNAAARRWLDIRAAQRQVEEARAWELEQIERESARERRIREDAKAKAEAIKRARAAAGPRWDEDAVDYACRVEAEDKIRRQRAAREPDSVDLALQRGGGPAPTRLRSRTPRGQEEIRAELAESIRPLLPPEFQGPDAPRAQRPRRSVRLRPAPHARYEVRG